MNVLWRKMNHIAFTKKLKQKDVKNKVEYEEPSVTHEVLGYFNVLECGRNILNRLDMTYEQACMATLREKYYTNMLETLVD